MNQNNWTLNTYTNDTWTALVDEPAVISTLIVSNLSGGDATVDIRLEDGGGTSLAVLLPPRTISNNNSYVFDVRSLTVTGSQRIQVRVNVAGVEFLASGAA